MSAILHKLEQQRLFDNDGLADDATITFYLSGTSTLATIYSDPGLTTPRANPVTLAAGASIPDIYLDSEVEYRRLITYSDGSTDNTDPYPEDFSSELLSFIASDSNAVPRSSQSKMRDIISVKDFGAVGDGSTDDTAAIQTAFDAINLLEGGELFFPDGAYKVTSSLLYNGQRINIRGTGPHTSYILFDPTSASVCIELNNPASGGMYQASIIGLGFQSNDVLYAKTAVKAVNVANVNFERNGIVAWGNAASIGFHIAGRQFHRIRDNEISCGRPIVFSTNVAFPSLAADHSRIENNELTCLKTDGICIEIENETSLSNTVFIGNAYVLGKYGVYWNSTGGSAAHFNIAFLDERHEQGTDAAGYCYHIVSAAQTIQSIEFRNIRTDLSRNGFYIRNAQRVILDHVNIDQSGGKTAIDMTGVAGSVLEIRMGWNQTGGVKTLTNMIQRTAVLSDVGGAINPFEVWTYDAKQGQSGTASLSKSVQNAPLGGANFTLANGARKLICDNSFWGWSFICLQNAQSSSFLVWGTNNSTTLDRDPGTIFSHTFATASKSNFAYDAAGAQGAGYYLENNTGSSQTYSVTLIGGAG